jgi:hypothetical protein
MSKKYPVTFDFQPTEPRVETCTFCGGKVEECPMLRGVCYNCYRRLITAKIEDEMKAIEPPATEQNMNDLHTHLEALDNGDWLSDAGPKLPPAEITTLQELVDAKDRDFNRRYYGNAEGKAEWSYRL